VFHWVISHKSKSVIAGVSALMAIAFVPVSTLAKGAPDSFADLAERLSPAVVNISTSQTVERPQRERPQLPDGSPFEDFFEKFFDQGGPKGPQKVQSLGSGFVIDAEGYVVTNNHVIEDADEITVNFPDGLSLEATLLGRDPKTDLALLKIEHDAPLPFVQFGDSEIARVGDWVLAIGNPFGLGGSVSAGIISARNRQIQAGPYDDFIQTDAAINKGNSGGPLFNMDGEVIGVNTAIISPSGGSIGIGFSVPSQIVKNVIAQLREYGGTRRGWLGVRIQPVSDEIAEGLGLADASGALVNEVTAGGPAESGGLQSGDVILKFDGREVEEMSDLPRMVAETEVGKAVDVEVWRKGAIATESITLGLLEEATGSETATVETATQKESLLGLVFEPLNAEARAALKIGDEVTGVLISDVVPESPAAEKGVRAGDVIVEINQQTVSSPNEASARIKEIKTEGRRSALLLLNRGGDLRFVAVRFAE